MPMKTDPRKRALSFLVSIGASLLFFLFAACGGGREPGVLLVGTEATYPPFEMTDASGMIVGFDIDLLNAIAVDQGLVLEFRDMDFDSLIPALQARNIDIAASGMSITPARLKQIAFSDPYIEAGLVVAVAADNTTISSVGDLANQRVAVQQGSTGAAKAEALKAAGEVGSIKYFPNVSVAIMELINGGADAIINDKPVTEAYIAKQPGKLKIVGATLVSDQYGFAVSRGNPELVAKLNAGLENVIASGFMDTLIAKYFD